MVWVFNESVQIKIGFKPRSNKNLLYDSGMKIRSHIVTWGLFGQIKLEKIIN